MKNTINNFLIVWLCFFCVKAAQDPNLEVTDAPKSTQDQSPLCLTFFPDGIKCFLPTPAQLRECITTDPVMPAEVMGLVAQYAVFSYDEAREEAQDRLNRIVKDARARKDRSKVADEMYEAAGVTAFLRQFINSRQYHDPKNPNNFTETNITITKNVSKCLRNPANALQLAAFRDLILFQIWKDDSNVPCAVTIEFILQHVDFSHIYAADLRSSLSDQDLGLILDSTFKYWRPKSDCQFTINRPSVTGRINAFKTILDSLSNNHNPLLSFCFTIATSQEQVEKPYPSNTRSMISRVPSQKINQTEFDQLINNLRMLLMANDRARYFFTLNSNDFTREQRAALQKLEQEISMPQIAAWNSMLPVIREEMNKKNVTSLRNYSITWPSGSKEVIPLITQEDALDVQFESGMIIGFEDFSSSQNQEDAGTSAAAPAD